MMDSMVSFSFQSLEVILYLSGEHSFWRFLFMLKVYYKLGVLLLFINDRDLFIYVGDFIVNICTA